MFLVASYGQGEQLTFGVDPLCIQIWQRGLVADVLDTLWRFLIQQTAGPSSPPFLSVVHGCVLRSSSAGRNLVTAAGETDGSWNNQRRQIDGIC